MTAFVGPRLLTDGCVLSGFSCGEPQLDEWLMTRAQRNQWDNSSRTWVVTVDDRVVAFYASSAAVVLHSAAPGRFRRNQPDPLPAVQLGRLAVDEGYQRQQLGAALLKHFLQKSLEVAEITGVRLVVVQAKNPGVAAFYRKYGFATSPVDDLTLMLLIQDVAASLTA